MIANKKRHHFLFFRMACAYTQYYIWRDKHFKKNNRKEFCMWKIMSYFALAKNWKRNVYTAYSSKNKVNNK